MILLKKITMIRRHLFSLAGFLAVTFLASCGGSKPGDSDGTPTKATPAVAQFTKHVLTREFISEGVTTGDVNRDGKTDVMAGAYWFEAPEWERHEIFPGKAFDGAKGYSNSFLNFSMDVNGDGWTDMIVVDFPGTAGYWYENPKNVAGLWKKHAIHETVLIGNESPAFVDIDGDGRTDILCADYKEKQMVWLSPPAAGADAFWTKFAISGKDAPGTDRFSHGLGYGDINKDGRNDVIIKDGWWEAPENRRAPDWTFHPANLGEDCSQMHVLDVNQDDLNDVVSASAHHYGIWWYEQMKDKSGSVTWRRHEISKVFSQSHSSFLTDLNGDGRPDLITGKRFFAHNDTDDDPGSHDPAVLYWFEYRPGGNPFFEPHLIDDDSGSGLNLVVADVTDDDSPDIVISNKKGVFVFEKVISHDRL